jgi:hypothetical protein
MAGTYSQFLILAIDFKVFYFSNIPNQYIKKQGLGYSIKCFRTKERFIASFVGGILLIIRK